MFSVSFSRAAALAFTSDETCSGSNCNVTHQGAWTSTCLLKKSLPTSCKIATLEREEEWPIWLFQSQRKNLWHVSQPFAGFSVISCMRHLKNLPVYSVKEQEILFASALSQSDNHKPTGTISLYSSAVRPRITSLCDTNALSICTDNTLCCTLTPTVPKTLLFSMSQNIYLVFCRDMKKNLKVAVFWSTAQ